ncbi:DUF4494 family protein, partial [Lishizhenia sp.]|uniref:DUF4494 family protein n=1 Tax=Lishizhenia sp. TaxID=2497594 RepID=UPI00299EDA7D
ELGQMIRGEFIVTEVKKANFEDIFQYEDADYWYQAKVSYLSVDADSGREKKISNLFLVSAENVRDAYDRIEESLESMLVSFEIPEIKLTPIVDIFPFNPDLDRELERREMTDEEKEEYKVNGTVPAFAESEHQIPGDEEE